MDYKRLALAAVVAWVVDSVYGLGVWMTMLGGEAAKYPGVFRSEAAMNAGVPMMLAAGLVAILALTWIYAKGYEGGNGLAEGLRFGVAMAVFMVGFVQVALYATLNIGAGIGIETSVASFVEMIVVGAAIGAVYRPAAQAKRMLSV